MSSIMTTRETNRLHRWAMWRMTVNEGIISCIRDNGTTRVIYPESSSDSGNSVGSEMPDFHEFPFITAEQMSLARKLNLREKYGSHHGLSDDAYFIFGLPRINIGKDIPEVTSTGTRSVYESFSESGETLTNVNMSRARAVSGGGEVAETNTPLNLTYYSELGPISDAQSMASHNDMEVQRINGHKEDWRSPVSPPVLRLNPLYSIQEELNNNNNNQFSNRRYPANLNSSSAGFSTAGDRDMNERGVSTNRYSLTSGPAYNTRETASRFPESNQFSAPINTAPVRQEVYPPFSNSSRQHSYSPTRMTYSSPPSSPQQNYSPQPTSPRGQSYPPFPAAGRQSYSPSPSASDRQSYSPMPVSPRQSGFPSTGGMKWVSSPGYGSKMRPTTLMIDGEAERMKRQAYYDWSTPTTERYFSDFASQSRYS